MQLCVEPSQLMPEPTMANMEFTQIILEETVTQLFPVYFQLIIIGMCATLSAIFSGLTTGLMALSADDLKVNKMDCLEIIINLKSAIHLNYLDITISNIISYHSFYLFLSCRK